MEEMLPMLVPQRSYALIPISGPEAPTPPPHDPPATDPTPDLPKPTDPSPETTDPEFPEPQLANAELRGVSPSILQN
jgi:hypothetical protein